FVAVLYPIVIVIVFLALRRPLGLLVAAVAATAGGLAAWGLGQLLEDEHPAAPPGAQRAHTWVLGARSPHYAYLAGAWRPAGVVVGALVGRRWRRAAWTFVAAVIAFRMLSGTDVPADLVIGIATGWACGDLALLAFGSPVRRSRGSDIVYALACSGYTIRRIA